MITEAEALELARLICFRRDHLADSMRYGGGGPESPESLAVVIEIWMNQPECRAAAAREVQHG